MKNNFLLLLPFLFLSVIIENLNAATVSCTSLFAGPASTLPGGKLEIKKNATLINTAPGGVLYTAKLKSKGSCYDSAGNKVRCIASGSAVPKQNITVIRGNGSNGKKKIKNNLTIDSSNIANYNNAKSIEVAKNTSLTLDNVTLHIQDKFKLQKNAKHLIIKGNVVIYAKTLELQDNTGITVQNGASVTIYLSGDAKFGKNTSINTNGHPENFVLFANKEIKFKKQKKKSSFSGFFYANKEIEVGKGVRITGSVTGKKVKIEKKATVTFSSSAVSLIATNSVCTGGGGGGTLHTITFNAVTTAHNPCSAVNDWDNNLTTQVVSQGFPLYILSKDATTNTPIEANLTSITLFGCNQSSFSKDITSSFPAKTDARGCAKSSSGILVNRAVKCLKVRIIGVDSNATSIVDTNESNSTDDFAVRPKSFAILNISSPRYAGEDFNISLRALDAQNAPATDYNETSAAGSFILDINETKQGCVQGATSVPAFAFTDGAKNDLLVNYDEVGDVKITLRDSNDSNSFAAIDKDDTPDAQRLIESNTTSLLAILPYEINVTDAVMQPSTGVAWLYMAKNLSDMNISLTAQITAYNKTGIPLRDYNASCYAQDLSVQFLYTTDGESDLNMTLEGNLTSNATALSDINKTVWAQKSAFVSGEGNTSYAFGIDRDYNTPKSPLHVVLQKVQVTSTNVAKQLGAFSLTRDNNATFYYGGLYARDLATSNTNDKTKAKIVVYNNKKSAQPYVNNYDQILLHWYYKNDHDNENYGKISEARVCTSTTLCTSTPITATLLFQNDGSYDTSISNSTAGIFFIHYDVSPWLWYAPVGFGEPYGYTDSNTTCLNHPCAKYIFTSPTKAHSVKSGSINGVDFNGTIQNNSRGIRLLR